jgi:hypothetical protein
VLHSTIISETRKNSPAKQGRSYRGPNCRSPTDEALIDFCVAKLKRRSLEGLMRTSPVAYVSSRLVSSLDALGFSAAPQWPAGWTTIEYRRTHSRFSSNALRIYPLFYDFIHVLPYPSTILFIVYFLSTISQSINP